MSYSRQQLYAMGEPFGECATRKEGGRIIYGGGGGGSSTPEKTTQVQDLPDWAKPSAQKLLGKAEALTEGAQYQPYQGERVAGFSPLQQQAMQGVARMDAGPQAFGQQVGQYMSPFMQNVVDRQKMEAYRASQLLGQQQQARATQAGAFGGYRDALERAERERGLRTQLDDIQAKGLQSAFDQAGQQFRQGVTQNMAINQSQAQMGGMQQQRDQALLDRQYQDFQNQQRYPFQQLEFMSNILRGTPMGTVNTMYAPGPTLGQTVGSLGLGAYGLGQLLKAEGGSVSSYADGGSVTDDNFVEGALRKLSDEQLQAEMQEAMAEGDRNRAMMIQAEVSRRASMRGAPQQAYGQGQGQAQGLASLFTDDMASNVLPSEESMARGGIVAFADGDLVDEEDDVPAGLAALVTESKGNPEVYRAVTNAFPALLAQAARTRYVPMSDEDAKAAGAAYRKELEDAMGESPYAGMRTQIEQARGERESNLAQGRGLAALQAAAALSQGSNLVRGLGNAGGAFAQSYGQALAADKAEKKALAAMEFNIADAERKERMGLIREATAASERARKNHAAAQDFKIKKINSMAGLTAKMASATKPTGKSGAGAGEKPPKGFDALAVAEYNGMVAAGAPANAETRRLAYRNAANLWGKQTGEDRTATGMAAVDARLDLKVADAINKAKFTPEYVEATTQEERDAILNRAAAEARRNFRTNTTAPSATPAASAAARPASAASAPPRPASAASAAASGVNNNSGQAQPNRLRFDAQGRLIP